MRILIIEDNPILTDTLKYNLKSFYTIDTANTGKKGMDFATHKKYDTILLDLRLPDMDGEDICRILRKRKTRTPIIILSGKSDAEGKAEMLNTGADDYITKPFNFHELRARIDVAIRRASNDSSPVIRIGGLTLDPSSRTVAVNGENISLRRKEFDLLELLMRHAGQSLSRTTLLEHNWDVKENLWGNVVDVHIKHLRDKIDKPYGTKLIKTVHGIGYKIQADTSGNAKSKRGRR